MQDISTMRHLQAIRERLSLFEATHPEYNTGSIPVVSEQEDGESLPEA